MTDQLQQLVDTLAVDGYNMTVERTDGGATVTVTANDGVCGDCLVPKDVMKTFVGSALDLDVSQISLNYPADAA